MNDENRRNQGGQNQGQNQDPSKRRDQNNQRNKSGSMDSDNSESRESRE